MASLLSASDVAAEAFNACVATGVRRRELDRGGRTLRWLEAGAGSPPIVFESGAASNAMTWAAVFAALAPHRRVVAYDRAGYGASDPAPPSVESQIADLVALLETFTPEPAVVVAHSWGGLLAQMVAWSRPELIGGLVLLDPSHERFWLDLTDPETLRTIGERSDSTRPAAADRRSERMLSYATQVSRELADIVSDNLAVRDLVFAASQSYLATDEQLRIQVDEVPMIVAGLDSIVRCRSTAAWPAVPTAVLTATKGRPTEFVAPVVEIHEQVAKAAAGRHLVVADSGHYIQIDRPDLVVRLVRAVADRTL